VNLAARLAAGLELEQQRLEVVRRQRFEFDEHALISVQRVFDPHLEVSGQFVRTVGVQDSQAFSGVVFQGLEGEAGDFAAGKIGELRVVIQQRDRVLEAFDDLREGRRDRLHEAQLALFRGDFWGLTEFGQNPGEFGIDPGGQRDRCGFQKHAQMPGQTRVRHIRIAGPVLERDKCAMGL
jgi:hypothetical protein